MKKKIDRHKSYVDSCTITLGKVTNCLHTKDIIYCRTNTSSKHLTTDAYDITHTIYHSFPKKK